MLPIINLTLPLFLIVFVAALLQYFRNIGDNWSVILNDFSLKIGLPVLVFSSLAKSSFSFSEQSTLLISNSLFLIGVILVALIIGKLFRLGKSMRLTLLICLVFSNIAYLGIPALAQIFGDSILPTAGLIASVYIFWVFTVVIYILDYARQNDNGEKDGILKRTTLNLFKNPLLIAVVLGAIVASFKITLPGAVIKSLDMVAAAVAPIVLVLIGLFIGKSKIGKFTEWIPVFGFSVATLLILPAGFYFGLKFFGLSPDKFAPSILQSAMPLAITPFALADKFNLNKEFIARSIVLSTILSVITLPFWIYLTAGIL